MQPRPTKQNRKKTAKRETQDALGAGAVHRTAGVRLALEGHHNCLAAAVTLAANKGSSRTQRAPHRRSLGFRCGRPLTLHLITKSSRPNRSKVFAHSLFVARQSKRAIEHHTLRHIPICLRLRALDCSRTQAPRRESANRPCSLWRVPQSKLRRHSPPEYRLQFASNQSQLASTLLRSVPANSSSSQLGATSGPARAIATRSHPVLSPSGSYRPEMEATSSVRFAPPACLSSFVSGNKTPSNAELR